MTPWIAEGLLRRNKHRELDGVTNQLNELFLKGYAAHLAGDADFVGQLIDDDVDWVLFGPVHIFPFVGPKRGRAAVLETIAHATRDYVTLRFDLRVAVEQGDWIAVLADFTQRQAATGGTVHVRLAMFLRYRDGKIVAFQGFFDSFDLAEQVLGRSLGM